MSISFENAFGIHESAIIFREQRAEVLANNLANADTPNFKARDIDFSKALELAQSNQSKGLNRTHFNHFDNRMQNQTEALLYRNPLQPDTGDGNSVDTQVEQMKFAENSMQYQTSLRFLDGKIKGLLLAIRGE